MLCHTLDMKKLMGRHNDTAFFAGRMMDRNELSLHIMLTYIFFGMKRRDKTNTLQLMHLIREEFQTRLVRIGCPPLPSKIIYPSSRLPKTFRFQQSLVRMTTPISCRQK